MKRKKVENIFHSYANAYDLLYRDKCYESECDFLQEVFKRFEKKETRHILDLGCGTGNHAIPLAQRGYSVFGIDRSGRMIEIARKKAIVHGQNCQLQFDVANIQHVNLCKNFDAVICMFAVLGYQTSNEMLFSTLCTVRKHLNAGGLFVCDFWYGPAVLRQRPTDRVKIIEEDKNRIIRLVKPHLNTQTNIVSVTYHLVHLKDNQLLEETEEVHHVRFIFYPEIEFMMAQAGLQIEHFCSFGEMDKSVTEETWNVSIIARAI